MHLTCFLSFLQLLNPNRDRGKGPNQKFSRVKAKLFQVLLNTEKNRTFVFYTVEFLLHYYFSGLVNLPSVSYSRFRYLHVLLDV